MQDNHREILNIKELSNWIHISNSKIRQLIYNNEIPVFKLGNRYFFKRDIIEQWLLNKHNITNIGGFKDALE